MFREFVTPYLAQIVASIHEAGGYAVKHTDGGVDSGGYIFASSNCIFAGVPIESYNLMLEVRKRYGYPGAKRPKDKFALPQGL